MIARLRHPNAAVAGASAQELSIAIGQVPLRLCFTDTSQMEKARERYKTFSGNSGEGLPVWVGSQSSCPIDTAEFAYSLDGASLRLAHGEAQFQSVPHEYALDSLIRILLSKLLLSHSGFLLHAATVSHHSRAHIFTGRSGAGKSTVASLSPPGSVLTDEISLLRQSEDHWQAFGTPFWGEFRAGDVNARLPIAGIYSLVQAQENRIERLSMRDALRALLPNVLFFSSNPSDVEQLLEIMTQVVAAVPVFRLHFERHAGFWEMLG